MQLLTLPNGNDIVSALRRSKRDTVRRKITLLEDFMPHEQWFALPYEERRAKMHGTISSRDGIWLSHREIWVRFRINGDELEMNQGNEWEPFPWPERDGRT